MYLSIIFLNLFNSILIGLLGKFIGRQASIFISLITMLFLLISSILLFYEILLNNNILIIDLYSLFIINDIKINIAFLFDTLSVIMLLVIITISTFVHIFTAGYMSHDPFIVRFYTFLGLFTFFMIILVTADNFLQLFIGWEGVGLCSYLLINFWYNRINANKAAIKAMLMNRIADVFFIFGILLILIEFKSLNYFVIFSLIDYIKFNYVFFIFSYINLLDLILFFLFLGAIGKSAQIGLHTWLPDAMEGPTPVSSLLHAATMVTAGVFLLVRCSFIFENSDLLLLLIVLFGAFTAIFAAFVAVFQYDIKKVIAYSTCSQLGYMFFSSGLSNYNITLFHLFNHAFFKALLFLGAGSIISSLLDEQDMRKMGSLLYKMPFTYISILIGSLAIMGFPFLTGFYSKDILIEFAYITYLLDGFYIWLLSLIAASLTACYSFKLIFFVFFQKLNFFNNINIIKENNNFIIFSLLCLSFLSIIIGFIFSDIFIGLGTNYFNNSIFISFNKYNIIESEFINPLIKNLPIIISLVGIFTSYIFFYKLNIKIRNIYLLAFKIKKYLFIMFFNAGFFNFFYNRIFVISFKFFYNVNVKYIEKGFFELLGPTGIYIFIRDFSYRLRFLSPFFINLSLLLIYISIVLFIYYILLIYWFSISTIYILLLLFYIIG
jgi:proton-translocating NADH-quinone oxidoreductase chain L